MATDTARSLDTVVRQGIWVPVCRIIRLRRDVGVSAKMPDG
jgi:hypothetical protein